VIDLRLLRADPERVRASQRARGDDPGLADALLAADERRRAAVARADTLRAEQKAVSERVRRATPEERPDAVARARELAATVRQAEADEQAADEQLRAAHLALPNVVEDGAPAGGEEDYLVLREVGEPPVIAEPRDHVELGELLDRELETPNGVRRSPARGSTSSPGRERCCSSGCSSSRSSRRCRTASCRLSRRPWSGRR